VNVREVQQEASADPVERRQVAARQGMLW